MCACVIPACAWVVSLLMVTVVRVRAQKKKDMPGRDLNLQSPAYKAETLPAGTTPLLVWPQCTNTWKTGITALQSENQTFPSIVLIHRL